MEIIERPIEEEKEAAEENDEDEEDEEDDDLVIVIDQGAIKTFFENFDLETQIKRQHQLEMEYEEYEVESEPEPEPEYSEYVKTMATLLGMPENQLQKLVENGKQHVIDQWLQRKMDHEQSD
jgi:hypothetical protein